MYKAFRITAGVICCKRKLYCPHGKPSWSVPRSHDIIRRTESPGIGLNKVLQSGGTDSDIYCLTSKGARSLKLRELSGPPRSCALLASCDLLLSFVLLDW